MTEQTDDDQLCHGELYKSLAPTGYNEVGQADTYLNDKPTGTFLGDRSINDKRPEDSGTAQSWIAILGALLVCIPVIIAIVFGLCIGAGLAVFLVFKVHAGWVGMFTDGYAPSSGGTSHMNLWMARIFGTLGIMFLDGCLLLGGVSFWEGSKRNWAHWENSEEWTRKLRRLFPQRRR